MAGQRPPRLARASHGWPWPPWPAAAGRGWPWPAAAGRGWPWPAAAGHGWLRLAVVGHTAGKVGYGPLIDKFRFLSRSVDLRLPSSQVDSPCKARRDALDGLTVAATLAHELFLTCDCLEGPRRRAADSRRQCRFIRAGTLLPAALTSACVLLPVPREVAFVTCCLR
jgi:hypothetical protein